MNSHPGVSEILALLDALKNVIRDFVAREEKLNGEFHAQTAAALSAFEAANQQQEVAATILQRNADAALDAEKDGCHLRFSRRKAWINRAHAAVSRRVLGEIGEQDAQWKDRTQQGVQEAEQRREADLAGATSAYDNFQLKLTEAGGVLTQLETAAGGAFRGYGKFRRLLALDRKWPEPDLSPDENALLGEMQRLQSKISGDLDRFRKLPLPLIFKFVPVWLATGLLAGVAMAGFILPHFGWHFILPTYAAAAAIALVAVVAGYFLGGRAAPTATAIAGDIAKARRLYDACHEKSWTHYQQEQERILNEFEETKRNLNLEWKQAAREISNARGSRPLALGEKASRLTQKNEAWLQAELERIQQHHTDTVARLKSEDKNASGKTPPRTRREWRKLKLRINSAGRNWRRTGKNKSSCCATKFARSTTCRKTVSRVGRRTLERLDAAANFSQRREIRAPRSGRGEICRGHAEECAAGVARSGGDFRPLSLVCPSQGSILFESGKTSGDEAFGAINNLIFRLLSATPPGKLNFTIFDPVGLGQNFAALTHLTDYEESSINSRIWTQTAQFEEKLAELNEHMEKIIQMYLRNEYATIAEYKPRPAASRRNIISSSSRRSR